jgi:hypothetical protein
MVGQLLLEPPNRRRRPPRIEIRIVFVEVDGRKAGLSGPVTKFVDQKCGASRESVVGSGPSPM